MNLGFKAFRVARTQIARDGKRRIWDGQDSFRNAIILDKGTTREGKLWGIYERCISIDLGCFRSRCLFPMLQNADSAKENEDPYPGRMSLIEHFGHRVAPVEIPCWLYSYIPISNSRYEGPNEILMGFLRLDKRRTGGAKRLHTFTWIRFIPNRPLEYLSIKHYDLGSGGLL